jgi:hypothetical protein
MAARHAEMRQQAETILRELRHGATSFSSGAATGAAAIENNGFKILR